MAAQSPTGAVLPDSRDAYLLSWAAITQMLGRGFSLSGRERNSCFLNLGNEQFADASAVSGFDFLDDGRALGLVDWDFDGQLDVWALNRNGPQLRFLHNRMGGNHHFIALRLEGTRCNRDAIGARVEITLAGEKGKTLIRTLGAGSAFLSQSSKWIHFGLGDAPGIETLTIRWPGGEAEVFEGVTMNRQYLVRQGTGELQRWTPPTGRIPLVPGDPDPPVATDVARIVLAARPVLPEISYQNLQGETAAVDDFTGQPVLVNLWATWCAPCLGELGALSQDQAALAEVGLKVLALNVDEPDEGGEEARRTKAAAVLKKLQYPFSAGTAGPEALARMDALQLTNLGMQIPISLPTSFLLDSRGLVSVIYKGPVTVEQLLADASHLESHPAERRNDAAPFPGKWVAPPSGTEPIRLALKMVDGGEREAGLSYLRRYLEKYQQGELPESDPNSGILETPLTEIFFAIARLHRQAGERSEAVAAYREILEIDPKHPKALLDLGHLFLRSGQPAMAVTHLDSLLAISPDHLDALSLSASAKLQLGNPKETETLCRRILQQQPDHATAHLNLGLVEEGRHHFDVAVDHYREALRVLPGWDIALNQLAWILATSPDDALVNGAEALGLSRQLIQLSGGRQPVFLRTLAAAQAESGQFDAALDTIKKALALAPPQQRGLRQTLAKMSLHFQSGRPYRLERPPER